MTWNEAQSYCRENNVDLVSVYSEEIQNWVERMVRSATSSHVWLGLRFSCRLKLWFWVTGSVACYQNWVPGNGSGAGHCGNTGAVQSGGGHQWVSLPETQKLNFICSK
ncbi:lithostathine-1-beta-like [Scleropages formosus]|nr:lithostathine-1-beta-like [Scleropages formosus]